MTITRWVFAMLLLVAGNASAQSVNPHGLTFTLDPARTEPGTIEVELGTLTEWSFDIPWIVKFTDESENFFLRDTEWAVVGSVRGGTLNVIIRRPLNSLHRLKLAVSPRLNIPIDGNGRPRAGFAVLGSFQWGLNSLALNTEVNETSGAVRKAISSDFAKVLGKDGLKNKVLIFTGIQIEATDITSISVGQGLAYRVRPNIELEAVFRQMNINRDARAVFITDLIFNLGRF